MDKKPCKTIYFISNNTNLDQSHLENIKDLDLFYRSKRCFLVKSFFCFYYRDADVRSESDKSKLN